MYSAGDASGARFPDHFDGKRFYNPDAPQAPGFSDLLRWTLHGRRQHSPRFVADVQTATPPRRMEGGTLRVTLVNHATVLLQHDGLNILTDPIWSERASPFSWIGPQRHRAPGVRWEDLPPIDVVLLSHNHYDHLDLPTLRRLRAQGTGAFLVPAGTARLLRSHKIGPVDELDWGHSVRLRGASVHSVPAMHFSARGLFDRNRAGWCGYVLRFADRALYFAGDTAFGPHFQWIRDRFGPPALALLPIGAYEPRWFMSRVHMGPEDAVRAHQILGAGTSIAIHHRTFQLADESIDAPAARLGECKGDARFLLLNNGQSVDLP